MLAAILALLAFFCTNENITDKATPKNITEKPEESLPVGIVPTNIEFFKIITNTEENSWQDLDNYYRNDILVNHKEKGYFNNLKALAIAALTRQFKLLENADNNTVQYYLNEQIEMEFLPESDIFIKYLVKLKDENLLAPDQFAEISVNRYNKDMDYIQNNFANPEEVLEKDNRGYRMSKLLKNATINY